MQKLLSLQVVAALSDEFGYAPTEAEAGTDERGFTVTVNVADLDLAENGAEFANQNLVATGAEQVQSVEECSGERGKQESGSLRWWWEQIRRNNNHEDHGLGEGINGATVSHGWGRKRR